MGRSLAAYPLEPMYQKRADKRAPRSAWNSTTPLLPPPNPSIRCVTSGKRLRLSELVFLTWAVRARRGKVRPWWARTYPQTSERPRFELQSGNGEKTGIQGHCLRFFGDKSLACKVLDNQMKAPTSYLREWGGVLRPPPAH